MDINYEDNHAHSRVEFLAFTYQSRFNFNQPVNFFLHVSGVTTVIPGQK